MAGGRRCLQEHTGSGGATGEAGAKTLGLAGRGEEFEAPRTKLQAVETELGMGGRQQHRGGGLQGPEGGEGVGGSA